MKKLTALIIVLTMLTAMLPITAAAEKVQNPLSVEQVLIDESFGGAVITRPVTNSGVPVRINGAKGFTYNTTDWGSTKYQQAAIVGGAYMHSFSDVSNYQITTVTAKPEREVPINLGDELHISFDYKFSDASSSYMSIYINDMKNTAIRSGSQKMAYGTGMSSPSLLTLISDESGNTTLNPMRTGFGYSSKLTAGVDYRVNLIIKTSDAEYSGDQTMTILITADGMTDITHTLKLDSSFTGVAGRWGYIQTDETVINPMTLFSEVNFVFETPKAAGDMQLDDVTVKKITNGYSVEGDSIMGVIPSGFVPGAATVAMAADVSYAKSSTTTGYFIVAQYDGKKCLADVVTKPVTIDKNNRVVKQNITIKETTELIKGFFWTEDYIPINDGDVLARITERLTGESGFTVIDFDANNTGYTPNNKNGYIYNTAAAGFGREGNAYKISADGASAEFGYIEITPERLYPKQEDATLFDISFAVDNISAGGAIEAVSYTEDDTEGEETTVLNINSNGGISILGYAAGKTITPEKWYSLKLYITNYSAQSGEPNAFSAYLDGQLVLDNKPFMADGSAYNNWYGFSKIQAGIKPQAAAAVYIDDFNYGISNTLTENSVIDSINTYYVNLIDNAKGVIYDGGQDFEDFADSMRRDGIISAEFTADNAYLKMADAKGGDIYYKVEPLPEDLSTYSVEGIDVTTNIYNPDLTNYYEHEQPVSIVKGSALDASFTLGNGDTIDKNGFIYIDGESFMLDMNTPDDTSDDKEIKFWGANVANEGAFPDTHEEAEKMADGIAAAGFNLVRFHRIDGGKPSLFGYSNDATHIDETAWDKFSYLVKCLRDRGVYYYIDQMVCMPASMYKNGIGNVAGMENIDGIGDGLAPICYFNEQAIALQKEFSRILLTKVNPYTGLTFAEDPAFAMMDLKNEHSMPHTQWLEGNYNEGFSIRKKANSDEPYYGPYYDELCTKYAAWLREKYPESGQWIFKQSTDDKLTSEWGSKVFPHPDFPDESSQTKVHLFRTYIPSDTRLNDEEEFIGDIMASYFDSMLTYLKNDVGVKCAITGNTVYGDAQVPIAHANAKGTDFVDIHMYWGHPTGTLDNADVDLTIYNFSGNHTRAGNVSQLDVDVMTKSDTGEKYLGNLGMLGKLASARVAGKPYVISEWLNCVGNPTHAEGPVIMSAIASMHKWNPIAFAWRSDMNYFSNLEDGYTLNYTNVFSMTENPVDRALFPAAAIMFNRGDITEAATGVYTTYNSDSDVYIGQSSSKGIWVGTYFFPDLSRAALMGKTGVKYNDVETAVTSSSYITNSVNVNKQDELDGKAVTYTSTTGELVTDLANGTFKINTPRSQAVSGYLSGKAVETDNLKLEVTNPFTAAILTSLSDSAIADSERMLLSIAGNTINHGQVLTDDGKYIKIPGLGSILTEQIVGDVTIKGVTGTYKVYALKTSGERKAELPVTQNGDGSISFTLTKDTEATSIEIVKE